jgi:hypothetical protein
LPRSREYDRHRLRRRRLELEARRCPLAGERGPQELERLRDLGQRLGERHLVPALDDSIRGGADAEHEPAVAGVGQGGRLLGQQGRPTGEDADHAGAQPDPLGPGRAQRQRREAVGSVRLAAPQVGVPGRLGATHQLGVLAQGEVRQRQRQAPAAHEVTLQSAVARRVPLG